MTIDPLSELDFHQSPYVYVSNNPIGRVDLFGMTDEPSNGGTLQEVVVRGKRERSFWAETKKVFSGSHYFGNFAGAYKLQAMKGEANPYTWTNQENNTMIKWSAGIFLGAYAGVAMVGEAGVAYVARAHVASSGRWLWQNVLSKKSTWLATDWSMKSVATRIGVNLFGKSLENSIKGESKFDAVGLAVDIVGGNLPGAIVGGVGEGGYNFSSEDRGFYGETNNLGNGVAKFATGIVFGGASESLGNYFGANGLSKIYEVTHSLFNKTMEEGTNAGADAVQKKLNNQK
jgi:hypothetical protein